MIYRAAKIIFSIRSDFYDVVVLSIFVALYTLIVISASLYPSSFYLLLCLDDDSVRQLPPHY